MLFFELSISKKLRGDSRFASRRFPKTKTLAKYSFVGRPFVACYACSTVYFLFFTELSFRLSIIPLISFFYSLTNKQKTSIFDAFRLLWAFFDHLLLSSLKLMNIFNSSFHGQYSVQNLPFKNNPNFFYSVVHSE